MKRPAYMILPITDHHHKSESRNIKNCKFNMIRIALILTFSITLAYTVLDLDENLLNEKCQMYEKTAYLQFSLYVGFSIVLITIIVNTVYKIILISKYGKKYHEELHCERTRKAMELQKNVSGTRILIGSTHCDCQRCNDLFNNIKDLEKGPKDESMYPKLGADIKNVLIKLPPTLSKV